MTNSRLTVSIGILARNEESGIGLLIADLSRQTLLTEHRSETFVHIVANACTDRTVEVAENAIGELSASVLANAQVHSLTEAGKSNAWNEFVHRIAPPSSEFVILLDGDIRIPDPNSLKNMVKQLAACQTAVVAIDRSVKDIEIDHPRGLAGHLIRLGTGTANDPKTAIAGACYCARYSEVRKIWMPKGLPGEDGFLRAMLLTESFSRAEEMERLLYVEDSYHVFESMRTLLGVFRHNVRLAIGTAVNILLFKKLRELRSTDIKIAEYIQKRNAEDPRWVNDLIKQRLNTSPFPLEPRFMTRRLRRLTSFRPSAKDVAVALMGFAFDVVVFLKANFLMRKGIGAGYW